MNHKTQNAAVNKSKFRVLLVDAHPIVRQGLAYLINQEADLCVCGEAEEAPKAFQAICALRPDLTIVDISLKRGDGIELIKNTKASCPKLSFLVFSMHDEAIYAERALRAGALGFVMKEQSSEVLLTAVRRVLSGEIYLSESMKGKLLQKLAKPRSEVISSPIAHLTDRELQVFALIGQGRNNRQVAAELNLSVRTVEAYREYIKTKLKLENSVQLLRHAFHWTQSKAAA
jgi:DNA-binding NarL/FixJ family response regulator